MAAARQDAAAARGDAASATATEGVASRQKSRACATCARLKMKCQWTGPGAGQVDSVCKRCSRLQIPCQLPTLLPRKKRGKSTKVAQLEQKIDGLVSLLAAGQQQLQPSPPPPTRTAAIHPPPLISLISDTPPETNGHEPHPTTTHDQENHHAINPLLRENSIDHTIGEPNRAANGHGEPTTNPDRPGLSTEVFELIPSFRLRADQAESYLELYRREYQPQFPFVIVPPSTHATTLYIETPGLFWAIMNVIAPQPSDVQIEVKRWIREYIAEHVVVQQEKRLELLQVILIYLGWNEFHFFINSQATNFLQLALALVVDLKLDKCALSSRVTPRSLLGDAYAIFKPPHMTQRTSHTPDEMRAVLGYYHLASLITALFRRGPRPFWNSHLAQCCDILAESCEYNSDEYLVAVVKMQRIGDRASKMFSNMLQEYSATFTTPQDMAICSLHDELRSLVDALPDSVNKNKSFLLLYHIITMRLYDPIISMRTSSPNGRAEPLAAEPFRQSDCLWRCLQAGAEFYEAQVTTPPSEILVSPSTALSLVAYVTITSSRLLLRDASPGWDPAAARRRLDLTGYLKRLADEYNVMEHVAEEAGRKRLVLDDKFTAFSKFDFKLRWIMQWYEAKVRPAQSTTTNTVNGSSSSGGTPTMGMEGHMSNGFVPRAGVGDMGALPAGDADVWQSMGFGEEAWQHVMESQDFNLFDALVVPSV